MIDILDQVLKWAKSQELIRAVVLSGSHADNTNDELSDYDVALFCRDMTVFLESIKWLEEITNVLVAIPEQMQGIPTRLVIFEEGKKVDFAFYPLEQRSPLPIEFSYGYRVLIDKDQQISPPISVFEKEKPTEEAFQDLIQEFWFEVYHVAKYLRRGDLWSVQFRLSGIHHQLLIKMICWNEAAKGKATHPNGKQLQQWVSDQTWEVLQNTFPHLDVNEGWQALDALTALFKQLSHETAKHFGFCNLSDLEEKISATMQKASQPDFSLTAGDNLQLRLLQIEDAPTLFKLVDHNRTYLRRFLGWLDHNQTEADTKAFILKEHEEFNLHLLIPLVL